MEAVDAGEEAEKSAAESGAGWEAENFRTVEGEDKAEAPGEPGQRGEREEGFEGGGFRQVEDGGGRRRQRGLAGGAGGSVGRSRSEGGGVRGEAGREARGEGTTEQPGIEEAAGKTAGKGFQGVGQGGGWTRQGGRAGRPDRDRVPGGGGLPGERLHDRGGAAPAGGEFPGDEVDGRGQARASG